MRLQRAAAPPPARPPPRPACLVERFSWLWGLKQGGEWVEMNKGLAE